MFYEGFALEFFVSDVFFVKTTALLCSLFLGFYLKACLMVSFLIRSIAKSGKKWYIL